MLTFKTEVNLKGEWILQVLLQCSFGNLERICKTRRSVRTLAPIWYWPNSLMLKSMKYEVSILQSNTMVKEIDYLVLWEQWKQFQRRDLHRLEGLAISDRLSAFDKFSWKSKHEKEEIKNLLSYFVISHHHLYDFLILVANKDKTWLTSLANSLDNPSSETFWHLFYQNVLFSAYNLHGDKPILGLYMYKFNLLPSFPT